jgi:hypothetical protein
LKKDKLNSIVDKLMGTSIAIYQTMRFWDNIDFGFIDKIMIKFQKLKSNSFLTPLIEVKIEYLKSVSLLNKEAPTFTLLNEKGVMVSLSVYVGKKVSLFKDYCKRHLINYFISSQVRQSVFVWCQITKSLLFD